MIYLTSTNQQAIISAQARISANCNFPKDGTVRWAVVQKAVDQDLWFMEKPMGYKDIIANTMLDGVDMTDIIEQAKNTAWFPPEVNTEGGSTLKLTPWIQ